MCTTVYTGHNYNLPLQRYAKYGTILLRRYNNNKKATTKITIEKNYDGDDEKIILTNIDDDWRFYIYNMLVCVCNLSF